MSLAFLDSLGRLGATGATVLRIAPNLHAVLAAMRRMEIPADVMTRRGFRASFRAIADEVLKFRVDWIEHQLAHVVKGANGRAYNRTSFLPERKRMMQQWADYLGRPQVCGSGRGVQVMLGNFAQVAGYLA